MAARNHQLIPRLQKLLKQRKLRLVVPRHDSPEQREHGKFYIAERGGKILFPHLSVDGLYEILKTLDPNWKSENDSSNT